MRSNGSFWNKPFSCLYVEKDVMDHPLTRKLVSRFPSASVIPVDHYKDVFNRQRQDYSVQYASQNLIIAAKKGKLIYEGAPVCQNFDNRWFYYCSCVLNCLYNCEYCWLKGIYASADPVIFVNLEDYFAELEKMLAEHPVYLSVSYETDLPLFEDLTGFLERWAAFTVSHPDLSIEIRTKCARKDIWRKLPVSDRVIPAFTVSPDEVITSMEHGTPPLQERIKAVSAAMEAGFPVRLSFDPLFAVKNWREVYRNMIITIARTVGLSEIRDVSVGTFRLSRDYLKDMRRRFPDSAVVHYPYELRDGYYRYPSVLAEEIETYVVKLLSEYMDAGKISRLEDQE